MKNWGFTIGANKILKTNSRQIHGFQQKQINNSCFIWKIKQLFFTGRADTYDCNPYVAKTKWVKDSTKDITIF